MVTIGGRAHSLEQIEEVGKLGYPFAEIDINDSDVVNQQFNDLIKLKEKYNLIYLAHYPNEGDPRNVARLEEQFVPKMKALFTRTHDLGIQKGTLHFWMDQRWAPSELVQQKIELLSQMVADAAGKGVLLCLENLTSQFGSFSTVLDAIPDLRMTLDIGHGQLLSEENTSYGFIEHLFHKIRHVHVHDNHGGTGVKDDLHLSLGDGIVDYPKILSLLKAKHYDFTITMEVLPSDMVRTKRELDRYIG